MRFYTHCAVQVNRLFYCSVVSSQGSRWTTRRKLIMFWVPSTRQKTSRFVLPWGSWPLVFCPFPLRPAQHRSCIQSTETWNGGGKYFEVPCLLPPLWGVTNIRRSDVFSVTHKYKPGLHNKITWHLTDNTWSPQKIQKNVVLQNCINGKQVGWEKQIHQDLLKHNYVFKDQQAAVVTYPYSTVHTQCLRNVCFHVLAKMEIHTSEKTHIIWFNPATWYRDKFENLFLHFKL